MKAIARIILEHSTKVKRGDIVRIVCPTNALDLARELYIQTLKKDAYPRLELSAPGFSYLYYKYASKTQLKHFPEIEYFTTKKSDVQIFIRAPLNTRELASIDPKKIALRRKVTKKIRDVRLKKRWVIFDYPCPALAQEADMSLEEYRTFVRRAVNINWNSLISFMKKVKGLFDNKEKIEIVSKDTHLTFSLRGRAGVLGDGTYNLPDGEVFYAPQKFSINGHIRYDFPAIYSGKSVEGIELQFRRGKVVSASAEKNEHFLKSMINLDAGSCYVGEFGIGCNYKINRFTKNILFDEKIGGTIHLALGNAYKMCGGKNVSALHWDMIKDLRKDGEIYINSELIFRHGKFIFK